MIAKAPVLAVRDLSIASDEGFLLRDITLAVDRGEVVGVVGESGSGKSSLGLACLGLPPVGTRIVDGEVIVDGRNVLSLQRSELRAVRGRIISHVPQDPSTALNPAMRVGRHIRSVLEAHGLESSTGTVGLALTRAGLPGDERFQRRYPHELSGGQQQRVAIASALACGPAVTVFDEPTTGLDVVVQSRIIDQIRALREASGLSALLISHDVAAVASLADRIIVMYAGRIVEEGAVPEILHHQLHPYTRALVASVPDHLAPRVLTGIPGVAPAIGDDFPGCRFAPRCPAVLPLCREVRPILRSLTATAHVACHNPSALAAEATRPRSDSPPPDSVAPHALLRVDGLHAEHLGRERVVAADEVSFDLSHGECLAIVGSSGSGKTTIARCIVGLHGTYGGSIFLAGEPLNPLARKRTREQRRALQIIFQNPRGSLNPRQPVNELLAWPAARLCGLSRRDANRLVPLLLERVRLPVSIRSRLPSELSGGECQRIAIARGVIVDPQVLICDEITSALDVSVQAAILSLVDELRRDLGLAVLFVTHDLGIVASIADRVLVLHNGAVQEQGEWDDILRRPQSVAARELVAAAPSLAASAP